MSTIKLCDKEEKSILIAVIVLMSITAILQCLGYDLGVSFELSRNDLITAKDFPIFIPLLKYSLFMLRFMIVVLAFMVVLFIFVLFGFCLFIICDVNFDNPDKL